MSDKSSWLFINTSPFEVANSSPDNGKTLILENLVSRNPSKWAERSGEPEVQILMQVYLAQYLCWRGKI
jgi:hypothetical protein